MFQVSDLRVNRGKVRVKQGKPNILARFLLLENKLVDLLFNLLDFFFSNVIEKKRLRQ